MGTESGGLLDSAVKLVKRGLKDVDDLTGIADSKIAKKFTESKLGDSLLTTHDAGWVSKKGSKSVSKMKNGGWTTTQKLDADGITKATDDIASKIKNINDVSGGVISKDASEQIANLNNLSDSIKSTGQITTDASVGDRLQAYFGDAERGRNRKTAAVLGYAGAAVGGRLLSGGSLTRDKDGNSDIAGVPFI